MSRRGVALLVVLAAVVLCSAVCTGVAHRAAADRLAADTRLRAEVAAGLLGAAEAPIREFLTRRAHRVVLPPESPSPEVAVLADAWAAGGIAVALRITAFDQCGMIPADAPAGFARFLGEEAREARGLTLRALAPGLDGAGGAFPLPARGSSGRSPLFAWRAGEEPALGALVATHNPPADPRRTRPAAGVINVNTAPRPLLKAAFAAAGRGGLEAVLRSRAAGEPAALPGAPADAGPWAPRFVGSSTVWSFRIDAAAGPVRRSWWVTYTRTSAGWVNVQTLPITR